MTAPLFPQSNLTRIGHVERQAGSLERRPAPSSSKGAWARVQRTTTFAVAATTSDIVPWTSFATSDDTVFATDLTGGTFAANNLTGDKYLVLRSVGVYVVQAAAKWSTVTTDGYILIETGGTSTVLGVHPDNDWSAALAAGGTSYWLRDVAVIAVGIAPLDVSVRAYNADGVSRNLSSCYLMAAHAPTAEGSITIY